LTTVKRFPHPAELFATNYYAQIDSKSCNGCGECILRCQLDAITIVNDIAIVNLDRCIGCGNCAVICEFNASRLIKKEVETVPPKDKSALYLKIMAKKSAAGT
jgi:ferredoxin